VVAFLFRRQNHFAVTGLARSFTFFRGFDAMVDGVAHQVDQRVGQGLDKVFVEVGFFTHQFQVDLFLELACQVANQARETAEDFLDRLHPGFHHCGLQVGGDHVEVRHGLLHGFIAAAQAQAHQAVTHQYQLANHVHDVVQTRGVDPHGGFGFAGRFVGSCRRGGTRRSSGGSRCRRGFGDGSCRSCLGGRRCGLGGHRCRCGRTRRHLGELALAV